MRPADPFKTLPRAHFGAILADSPWRFQTWSMGARRQPTGNRAPPYRVRTVRELMALPVADLALPNCLLCLWASWPMLMHALATIEAWGFVYKTCAFDWMKINKTGTLRIGTGYWTRANTEPCLLATRGKPKRRARDVRQAILEPRREHSRKPDCVHERIERLVAGPYLELFARASRPGWTTWGDQRTKFDCLEAAE